MADAGSLWTSPAFFARRHHQALLLLDLLSQFVHHHAHAAPPVGHARRFPLFYPPFAGFVLGNPLSQPATTATLAYWPGSQAPNATSHPSRSPVRQQIYGTHPLCAFYTPHTPTRRDTVIYAGFRDLSVADERACVGASRGRAWVWGPRWRITSCAPLRHPSTDLGLRACHTVPHAQLSLHGT